MTTPAPDQHDPFNSKRPEVFELRGWRRVVVHPLAWLLRLYCLSWRIAVRGGEREILRATRPPRCFLIWHNRSLAAPIAVRRLIDPARVACLISPSRMAAWEVAFFRMLGFKVVRGSTTRRSIQAGMELLRALRAGDDAGISPDGPSGPLYSFQPGAVMLARKAAVPLVILVPNARAALRLRTWDRHLVPLPFARVELRVRLVAPDDPLWRQTDEAAAAELRRVCLEMTEDPFRLPGHE